MCRHGACATKENLPVWSDGTPAIGVQRKILVPLCREPTESFSAVLLQDTPLGVLIGFRYGEAHSLNSGACATKYIALGNWCVFFFID